MIEQILGESRAIKAVREEIGHAANSDAKVLITGESGTGKELVANAIHKLSKRRVANFVPVNAAGIPDSLLEAELFGHARGAFTDAHIERLGKLKQADRGTFFLDEIGETSSRLQSSLLRFLETGELQTVGAERTGYSDVRFISATNRNLAQMAEQRIFREDLLHRIRVVEVNVPPLRYRREDIPALLQYFIARFTPANSSPIRFSPAAMRTLMDYDWPGNIRELRSLVEAASSRYGQKEVPYGAIKKRLGERADTLKPKEVVSPDDFNDVQGLYKTLRNDRGSFWDVVYEPFMGHDIRRETIRGLVKEALTDSRGNYKLAMKYLQVPEVDYKRFMNFLNKYDCHIDFRPFRLPGLRGLLN